MNSETRKKVVRTRFLIFPQFQLRLLAANLAVIVVIAGIIWYQMTRSFTELTEAAGIAGVEAEFYRNYLAFHSRQLNVSLTISFVTAIVVSMGLTLVLSHRFSGPLVRLRGYFRHLSEKHEFDPIPQLNFRRGDYLCDIPPLVNQAIDRIQREAHDPKRKSA